MNIDELTISQVKELKELLGLDRVAGSISVVEDRKVEKALIGEYVIVRCRDAGVHAGTLVDYEGRTVVLKGSRRLYKWKCAGNLHTLSGVAEMGIVEEESTICAVVNTITLLDACEIIETTPLCGKSIIECDTYEVN